MKCLIGILGLASLAGAATLERLSLDQMTSRSTAIVRVRALSSATMQAGSTIYTRTRFQVLERWKGPAAPEVEVSEPGGTLRGMTQSYSGVPRFVPGQELVLFLWTGPSGRTQVIGLSQGVFEVGQNAMTGQTEVKREAVSETMLDGTTGLAIRDERIVMPLEALATQVRGMVRSSARGESGK